MKRVLIGIFFIMMIAMLSGCGDKQDDKSFHELKMSYVALNTSNENVLLKSFPFFMGERQLKYSFKIPNDSMYDFDADLTFETLSAPANFAYNFSYIVNLPAKLYRNIHFDFTMNDETADKVSAQSGMNNTVKVITSWYMLFLDIVSAVFGLILSIIMLFVGTIFGLILHPIRSFTELFPSIWGMIKTLYFAVANFFVW